MRNWGFFGLSRRGFPWWGTLFGTFGFCVLFAFSLLLPAFGANAPLPEYKVKAAYLYNFLHFVVWPEEAPLQASETVNVLIVGSRDFRSVISPLEQQAVGGKKLDITLVSTLDARTDLKNYHLVYLAKANLDRLPALLQKMAHLPLLTVGEQSDFAEAGGMIGFVSRKGKIKFIVNRAALKKGNLSMRSKALRLAEKVIE